ncbi:MAG: hypothetical protein ABJA98_22740 [Acidobacteriota bacterium]
MLPIALLPQIVLIYLLLCMLAAFTGRRRRIGFWGFFFLSIMLTPIVTSTFIYFAAPRPRRLAQRRS